MKPCIQQAGTGPHPPFPYDRDQPFVPPLVTLKCNFALLHAFILLQ